jgi:hypothetical protein
MNYKDIKLNDGQVIRVWMPPTVKITTVLAKKYQAPEIPIVEVKTAAGETERIQVVDDPTYLAEKKRVDEARDKERDEWYYLYALRDVQVPADFDVEVYRPIAEIEDENWQPREGQRGRKLDYLEWELMGDPSNYNKIQQALVAMMTTDEETIGLIEESFRSDVAGSTA